jgi:AbrB family looped-hinge helix DNA binding protein
MDLIVDKLGRLVIPKDVRDHYQLQPGAIVRLEEIPGGIVLIPVTESATIVEKDGLPVVTSEPIGPLDTDRLLHAIRNERDLRHAGLHLP